MQKVHQYMSKQSHTGSSNQQKRNKNPRFLRHPRSKDFRNIF